MADYVKLAKRAARRHGFPADVFVRLIRQESGFNPRARSPKGALGIAQIMPATAKGWGVDPFDPEAALDASAKNLARYRKQFGSVEAALRAYNAGPGAVERSKTYPETNAYVKAILGNNAKTGPDPSNSRSRGQGSTPGTSVLKTTTIPAKTDVKQAILDAFMEGGKNPVLKAAGRVSVGLYTTPSSTRRERVRVPGEPREAPTGGGSGQFKVAKTANRAGVGLADDLTDFLGKVSGLGPSFTVTTGSQHSRLTTNGKVSDHWDGHGADIAVPVDSKRGDRIAAAALEAAGVPRKKARRLARNGGLYNINYNGKRVQIIWKTYEGGNHHNHVHIGIR